MKKEIKSFGAIELSRKLLLAVNDMGFEEPSPIQAQTIPLVLEGHDVIGQAQTGTGKTAAFGIPTIEKIIDAIIFDDSIDILVDGGNFADDRITARARNHLEE